jgi:ribonucleoside-diphosphate reductase alpha chain
LRLSTSIVDYIFRRIAVDYLPLEDRKEMGILTSDERTQPTLPGVEEVGTPTVIDHGSQASPQLPLEHPAVSSAAAKLDAPLCYSCGNEMQRAGSCYVCGSCGTTSGCS